MSASDVLVGDLRRICGHDSRSVDGCVTCEAADRIETDYRQSAAVAELVRLTERVLYVQSLTGNAKAQAWDKLDRDLRAALARVQGGAA